MNYDRLILLIEKIENRTASQEEIQEVDFFYKSFNSEPALTPMLPNVEVFGAELESRIRREIAVRQNKLRNLWLRIAGSAAIVIFALGTYYLVQSLEISRRQIYSSDVAPAEGKATLSLSNGKKILLDEKSGGIVISPRNISYEDGKSLESVSGDIDWVTLTTPNGGNYNVVLIDGTNVTLNAGSSLKYPTRFSQAERRVELKGEAYFNVKHSTKQKFIVKTSGQLISVLGTKFNVRAYTGREETSLLSGSVCVRSQEKDLTLVPGEQAVVSGNTLQKQNVDVDEKISWIEGRIVGSLIGLQELSLDIERRYDVKFVFTTGYKPRDRAYINLDATERLSVVLRALEQIYKVQFKIKGKEVFVF